MNNIREHIVDFIVTKFETTDLKQIDLANKVGVNKSTVTHWIKGRQTPDINLIPAIAEFFNVSIYEVLGINEEVSGITSEEMEFIRAYQKASERDKKLVREILNVK